MMECTMLMCILYMLLASNVIHILEYIMWTVAKTLSYFMFTSSSVCVCSVFPTFLALAIFAVCRIQCADNFHSFHVFNARILIHGRRNIRQIYLVDSNTNKWKESVLQKKKKFVCYLFRHIFHYVYRAKCNSYKKEDARRHETNKNLRKKVVVYLCVGNVNRSFFFSPSYTIFSNFKPLVGIVLSCWEWSRCFVQLYVVRKAGKGCCQCVAQYPRTKNNHGICW